MIKEEKKKIATKIAFSYIGKWYKWGGDDPSGFDCCFPQDIPILTPKGFIAIQEIKKGNAIFTFKDGKLVKEKY